jgi:6-phosphogluconolactonase
MASAHPHPELTILPDAAQLAQAAVNEFRTVAQRAIAQHGRFTVALSGGNTPRSVYLLLAQQGRESLHWQKIFIFFGDERHVPPDDLQSNYRMARESLLAHVPLPKQNVFRVIAELPAEKAAKYYEDKLRSFFQLAPDALPRFDLIFLGLGEDGHTASLFPGSAALAESKRLVVANWVEKFQSFRITLTFPVLNAGAEVVFLVSGESKAEVVRDIFTKADAIYPSQMVRPREGRLLWMLDQPAAALLETAER